MSGDVLALGGIGLVVVAGVVWFRLLRAVRIPRMRVPFLVAMAAGGVLGAAGLVQGTGLLGSVAAWLAISGAAVFLGLRAQSAQRSDPPAVAVGGPILDFEAPDESGARFDLASLRGRPFLLKFFRGHW